MLIPEMFYGTYSIVKKRTNKAIRDIIAGESLEKALKIPNMIDTSEKSGILYMGIPIKGFEEGLNFHLLPFAFNLYLEYLRKKITSERDDEIYQNFIQIPWGILLLISRDNAQAWLHDKKRFQTYIDAALPYMKEFSELGDRFETSGSSPESFWDLPNGLFYALANLGISTEAIFQIRENRKIPPLETLIPK